MKPSLQYGSITESIIGFFSFSFAISQKKYSFSVSDGDETLQLVVDGVATFFAAGIVF